MMLATRSTEVTTVAQCPGRYALTLCAAEQAACSFFDLGTAAHSAIDASVKRGLDQDQALTLLGSLLDHDIERAATAANVVETAKRTYASIQDDAARIVTTWFAQVHPDSPHRHPLYGEYLWKPETEIAWHRDTPAGPMWGTADALFQGKHGAPPLLVDWKSGLRRQGSSFQLHFYMMGMGITHARAVFHNLNRTRQPIQEAEPYPGDASILQRLIATNAIKDAIRDGEYPRFNRGPLCSYCPVRASCPAFGPQAEREARASTIRRALRTLTAA